MARLGLRALWRSAFAMLVCPVRRSRLIARLRMLAMMRGPAPVAICEASSPMVTSRTQCSLFSTCQWPRM
jgi:hypothetical protein